MSFTKLKVMYFPCKIISIVFFAYLFTSYTLSNQIYSLLSVSSIIFFFSAQFLHEDLYFYPFPISTSKKVHETKYMNQANVKACHFEKHNM
jgi:hypothetical protein